MRNLLFIGCLFLMCWSSTLPARSVNGVALKDRVELGGGQALVLNGAGTRKKFFFSIYVCALYLSEPSQDVAKIYKPEAAKRILMHFVYKSVDKQKLISGWQDGFAANHSGQDLKNLFARIEQLNQSMETMKAGEQIIFDYLPDRGTVVMVKGKEKSVISGADFYNALLDIWLGKNPINKHLKSQLLGK